MATYWISKMSMVFVITHCTVACVQASALLEKNCRGSLVLINIIRPQNISVSRSLTCQAETKTACCVHVILLQGRLWHLKKYPITREITSGIDQCFWTEAKARLARVACEERSAKKSRLSAYHCSSCSGVQMWTRLPNWLLYITWSSNVFSRHNTITYSDLTQQQIDSR